MKEREAFLDRLRVLATCAVVLLHTVTGVMDNTDMGLYPAEKKVFLVVMDLVCWCVPVFLVISGYLFLNPERKLSMGKMIVKYCRRIALALFLFGVPYGCVELVAMEGGFRPGMLGEAILMVLRGESWSHMWYLYLILFLYAITPFLKWVLEAIPRWAVYLVLLALFLGCSVLPYVNELFGWEEGFALPGDGIYFFYYICGYMYATAGKGRHRRAVRSGILPGAALLLAAGMAISRLSGRYVLQMAYNYPFTVLLTLVLFSWGNGTEHLEGAFWERAAAISFAIYLIHPVFLNFAYKFLHVTPLAFGLGLSLPLFFTGTVLLSAICAWMLCRIRLLRKYVL